MASNFTDALISDSNKLSMLTFLLEQLDDEQLTALLSTDDDKAMLAVMQEIKAFANGQTLSDLLKLTGEGEEKLNNLMEDVTEEFNERDYYEKLKTRINSFQEHLAAEAAAKPRAVPPRPNEPPPPPAKAIHPLPKKAPVTAVENVYAVYVLEELNKKQQAGNYKVPEQDRGAIDAFEEIIDAAGLTVDDDAKTILDAFVSATKSQQDLEQREWFADRLTQFKSAAQKHGQQIQPRQSASAQFAQRLASAPEASTTSTEASYQKTVSSREPIRIKVGNPTPPSSGTKTSDIIETYNSVRRKYNSDQTALYIAGELKKGASSNNYVATLTPKNAAGDLKPVEFKVKTNSQGSLTECTMSQFSSKAEWAMLVDMAIKNVEDLTSLKLTGDFGSAANRKIAEQILNDKVQQALTNRASNASPQTQQPENDDDPGITPSP